MENKASSEMTKLANDSLHKTVMRTITCEEIKVLQNQVSSKMED